MPAPSARLRPEARDAAPGERVGRPAAAVLARALRWLRGARPAPVSARPVLREPTPSERVRRTELALYKRQVDHKNELLRASAEFQRIINNNDQVDRTIDLVLHFMRDQVGAHEITLFLVNERTGRFEPTAQLRDGPISFGAAVDVLGIGDLGGKDFAECAVSSREVQALEYLIYLASDKRNIGAMKVLVPLLAEEERNLVRDVLEHMKSLFALSLTKAILRQRSITDELTGLHNKAHFLEVLGEEFRKAQYDKSDLYVMMLDIDHFKKVNDTFGHLSGDIILREVARVLRDAAQEAGAHAFRFGGEEMNLILSRPGCAAREATELAERIRRGVETYPFRSDKGEPVPVTLSIGVAGFDPACADPEALYVRADRAVYFSKDNGRNLVSLYGPAGIEAISRPVGRRRGSNHKKNTRVSSEKKPPANAAAAG